jgi:hypothetical protein
MTTPILDETTRDQLVRTCRTDVGDSLRSIAFFTRDDYEQLYLRSDLEQDADLASFIGHEWYDFSNTQTAYTYQDSELGGYEYTIRVFENGFLVRVDTGTNGGVLVTTDGLTMQGYESLVQAIRGVFAEAA